MQLAPFFITGTDSSAIMDHIYRNPDDQHSPRDIAMSEYGDVGLSKSRAEVILKSLHAEGYISKTENGEYKAIDSMVSVFELCLD